MALNFPADTTEIYIDPVSGLKYIFNTAVGAWETAIQPPVIVSDSTPSVNIPGFLWWDTITGSLFVRYKDSDSTQWVEAVPTPNTDRNIYTSDNPPSGAVDGDLWWCTKDNSGGFFGGGRLYIYFIDENGTEAWIEASPNVGFGGGNGGYDGPTISNGPNDPQGDENDLWYDTNPGEEILKIRRSGDWTDCVDLTSLASDIVVSLTVQYPLENVSTNINRPELKINEATNSTYGSMMYATQSEVDTGNELFKAVSPGTLKLGIGNYLPDATETSKGVIQLASQYEVNLGTNQTKAITPNTLKASLPVLGVTGNPTGTVISFAGDTAPDGYLICDGTAVSRTIYDDLYATISTKYGAGNGTSTFNLPDLRGEFIRGWSSAGGTQRPGVDVGRQMGSSQDQEIQSHSHTMVTGAASTGNLRSGGGNRAGDTSSTQTNKFPTDPDAETRPRNVAMMYCIKT